jgi:predicted secreted hydrolase
MTVRALPVRGIMAAAVLVLLAVLMLRMLGGSRPRAGARATLALQQTLGGDDTAGYARAIEPREFTFPHDYGPHPGFRTEWWYITGNLDGENGERFGWQLTFFRSALAARMPARPSPWATRHAWMAHFALTDGARNEHHAFERFSRSALGLAGAEAAPFRVWLDRWTLAGDTAAGEFFPLRAIAAADDIAIDLVLGAGKALVAQGERGLSRKGAETGNASYYWSFTRLPTTGTVRVGGRDFNVQGASWLDREWSTSALADGVTGWDWFALQLADSTELMFYRLRRDDGTTDAFSAGTWVDARGVAHHLDADDVSIEVLDSWRSPLDGAVYPARWQLRVPSIMLALEIAPVVADQELNVSVRYWEGAVDVHGERAGSTVRGRGYVELTGYGESGSGTIERTR